MNTLPLKLAIIGCGNRARVYSGLLAERPDEFQIVAAADPDPKRVSHIHSLSSSSDFATFASAEELLCQQKLADIMLIATQDSYHLDPVLKAIDKGYDILLEKPICDSPRDILEVSKAATRSGVRVVVCHVLRYTSFYQKLKEIVSSGRLGQIITVNASEGIEAWHFAHSYVRGPWAVMEDSTPTIVAKCSHDMDLLHWILEKRCERVSSFGELTFFKSENAHLEKDYPMFDRNRYLYGSKNFWLDQVIDDPLANPEQRRAWLLKSNWYKSVFHGENTALDHQVLNLAFEDGITATFTMSAFDEGRNCEIQGTRASLRAGDFCKENAGADIIIKDHDTGDISKITVLDQNTHPKFGGYHMGGDVGFIKSLLHEFTNQTGALTSLSSSVHSHMMAFAAEQARKCGTIIDLKEYINSLESNAHALD